MRALAATLGVAALFVTSGSVARPARVSRIAAPAPSHCAVGQRAVYSCRFGAKIGSLCLGNRSLHYRFGPLGRPEIDLASAPDWSNVHTHRLYSHALAQNHVRMTRGSINYIVHFGEAGNLSDVPGKSMSGLVVVDGRGNALADRTCKSGAWINADAFLDIPRNAPPGWEGDETPDGPFDDYF